MLRDFYNEAMSAALQQPWLFEQRLLDYRAHVILYAKCLASFVALVGLHSLLKRK